MAAQIIEPIRFGPAALAGVEPNPVALTHRKPVLGAQQYGGGAPALSGKRQNFGVSPK
jgi:hypothetical protein